MIRDVRDCPGPTAPSPKNRRLFHGFCRLSVFFSAINADYWPASAVPHAPRRAFWAKREHGSRARTHRSAFHCRSDFVIFRASPRRIVLTPIRAFDVCAAALKSASFFRSLPEGESCSFMTVFFSARSSGIRTVSSAASFPLRIVFRMLCRKWFCTSLELKCPPCPIGQIRIVTVPSGGSSLLPAGRFLPFFSMDDP